MKAEEESQFAPFYEGQKVIGVSDNPLCKFKKGDNFIIRSCHYSMSPNPIANGKYFWYVGVHGYQGDWYSPKLFAPIEENFQSISLENVLEKETPLICVN